MFYFLEKRFDLQDLAAASQQRNGPVYQRRPRIFQQEEDANGQEWARERQVYTL